MADVTFGVLGPLTVTVHAAPVRIGAPKVRVILAHLLLHNGAVVSTDELVDGVWGGAPPRRARDTLQTYVMRLRQALDEAGDVIRTEPSGYLISVADDAIDLGLFRALAEAARVAAAAGDLRAARDQLARGLDLWRGRPLTDIASQALHREQVPRLVEEHLRSLEQRIDLDLGLGRHDELVSELRELTARLPLREKLWGQLMLALYRINRQADALSAYQDLAALLREELGVDPCAPVRRLHHQILTHHAALEPPRQPPAEPPPASSSPPFQLPGDVPDFVGREDLTARIRALIDPPAGDPAIPGVILSGLPGVGKTALAAHVAHHMPESFPDGQLYVDMRGYSHGGATPAGAALTRLVRALGVAPEDVPAELDAQSALFRSLLNGRRILILLDNVISADQVRPLLPGQPGSVVLVTSRDTLGGLSAINGMRHVRVDPVTPDEAMTLLRTILGPRLTDEPEAAKELAALCGNLPLALRIAAANLAAGPGQSVAGYVAEVRAEGRVSALAIDGDDNATVDVAFDLSYQTLPPDIARMFRLLSLIPGADFDKWAAANIAGVDPHVAGRTLARLASANLIQRKQNRYHFHDLIREYAHRRCLAEDGDEAPRTVRRLFDFYLHTTDQAVRLLHPDLPRLGLPTPPAPLRKPPVLEASAASGWLDAEISNLEAMVCGTVPGGDTLPVWLLAGAMLGYLDQQRLDSSWHAICATARDRASRHGERRGEAAMLRALGRLHYLQTRYDLAEECYLRAADTFRETGDLLGEVSVLNGLGGVAGSSSDYTKANEYLRLALRACEAAGDRTCQAETMTNLGTSLVLVGQAGDGLAHLESARAIAVELNLGHISARAESAIALHDLYCGALDDAAQRFGRVLDTCRKVDYRTVEAQTLRNLAEVELDSGRPWDTYRLAERALQLADQIDAHWHVVGAHVTLGLAAIALGDLESAARHLSHADDLRGSRVRFWWPFAMVGLSACRRLSGTASVAEALTEAASDPRPRARVRVQLELARVRLCLGEAARGLAHAREAGETARRSGYRLDLATALELAADLHEILGDLRAAADCRAGAAKVHANACPA